MDNQNNEENRKENEERETGPVKGESKRYIVYIIEGIMLLFILPYIYHFITTIAKFIAGQ